jgi:TRAP-type transport system periplasmic protein
MENDMTSQIADRGRRKFMARTGATVATLLSAPSILRAQTTTLTMSSWLPPNGAIAPNLLDPWIEGIAAVTDGRVQIEKIVPPMGPPPAHWDLVHSGKCDIAYALHGYSGPDAFLRARIGQFSFLGDSFSASHAFSKVYRELLDAEKEHEGVRMLGVFQHGTGQLFLRNKQITSIDDFKGLRVRNSGGYISQLLEDLGCVAVPMAPNEVRAAFEEDRVDGVMFPYEGVDAFNIADLVTNVSELPGGYFNASWFMAMNVETAERLGTADFEAIKSYSLQVVHELAAKAFDYADYMTKEKLKSQGVPVDVVKGDTLNFIEGKSQAYERQWIDEVAAQGYDGKRALAYTRRITGQG